MPTGSRSLGQARKDQHGLLGALIRPIFNQPDRERARDALSTAVTQLDGRLPKVAGMLEDAEDDNASTCSSRPTKMRLTSDFETRNPRLSTS